MTVIGLLYEREEEIRQKGSHVMDCIILLTKLDCSDDSTFHDSCRYVHAACSLAAGSFWSEDYCLVFHAL